MQFSNILNIKNILSLLIICIALPGCDSLSRIRNIGSPPPMTHISDPTKEKGYRPVQMPMPEDKPVHHTSNSLWDANTRSLFDGQRANKLGDILTVVIDFKESAKMNNESTRGRINGEGLGVPNLLGFSQQFAKTILPAEADPTKYVSANSKTNSKGFGNIKRDEEVKLRVAAVISQVLPNGNFVVHGRQEIRVNHELRELRVGGVIRPVDLTSQNTINYDKIAEARISYGGRGDISEVQQPRYGQKLLDIILPF